MSSVHYDMKQCFVNAEILEESKKLRRYESNWLWQVTWMYNRMQKIMLNYRPDEWRWLGRPLKILLDEAETGDGWW
jgi:hypothetical protein